ncbi:MAG: hypothetical protein RLZZ385_1963 [Pseudomonadota bacterium]|jgi:uncharacterized protein YeaC (DUF1315 family)
MNDLPLPSHTPATLQALLETLTPTHYESLKDAVALGRWANGQKLSPEQLENSLQLIIAWESRHVPVEQRLGFIDPSRGKPACKV